MSNSTVYLDKIYSKDGNTEIVDTVNRSVKAKTIELGGNIIASHSGVEGAGTVTLQNTTLDSGVTFPAGHVIQTVYSTKNDESSARTTSSTPSRVVDASNNPEWSCSISNLKSNSDVLIITTFVSYLEKTSNQIAGSFHIFRDTDGAGSNLTAIYTTSNNTGQLYEFTDLASTGAIMYVADLQTMFFIDESPTNSTHTYYLGYSSQSSTKVSIENKMPFTMVLQEIAR